ncbi:MAG TPA: GntR family transcriptional regulator [Thermotogota bacterium]|nr:GntR family transcriptional regulator [Thermotogota bacterium]HPJ88815.1 GntR family transcriptional regulator [Thermotogota bacterium]HPR96678.1 GntR family transcriptional regulator [Thermotogota bacterium]
MWIKIELRSPLPVYEQIKVGIKEAILSGKCEKEELIPSIRELAKEIKVNPNTVARAYRELEQEGVIFSRQGIGFMINVSTAEIKEQFLSELEKELRIPLKRLKKSGIALEEVQKVVGAIWEME